MGFRVRTSNQGNRMNFGLIFMTGLTTGGLTCLAIQGGLLATALARPVVIAGSGNSSQTGIDLAKNLWPVIYFLAAKLLAHTLLGSLLGALGSVMQLAPSTSAIMQLLAGSFMIATALNMGNVHPIFRYAVIQPPKALTRLVRNQAKTRDVFTPVLLGFMTVLIPCGTTQAMELLAISSGSAILGALIMAVFVVGTSPTFLALGFLATRLRGQFQSLLAIGAALAILVLGVLSIDAGLNLLGSPLAPRRLVAALFQSGDRMATTAVARDLGSLQEITIDARNAGYFPNNIRAQAGKPIRLRLVSVDTYACTRAFVIPSLGIHNILPTSGETIVEVPAQSAGQLFFTCGMGMYSGTIQIG